jgi:hypothetical protein
LNWVPWKTVNAIGAGTKNVTCCTGKGQKSGTVTNDESGADEQFGAPSPDPYRLDRVGIYLISNIPCTGEPCI